MEAIEKARVEAAIVEEAARQEAAAKLFEVQFDEQNKKVEEARKELELERLKRAEEKVQFEQRMSVIEAERRNL